MRNFTKRNEELISLFNKNKLLILRAIYKCSGNTCNCDIVENLDIPKNLISYHIKTLEKSGFIERMKCGKRVRYTISNNEELRVKTILNILELI